ncbi:MAG: terminase, partial [Stenotrophobium sp.]
MNFQELLDWQWKDYADKHRNHTSLIIHIIAVPLFWLGALDVVSALLFSGLLHAIGGIVLMGLSLFAQGKGHEMEKNAPEPFKDVPNFILRVIAEQFVTFPRFV